MTSHFDLESLAADLDAFAHKIPRALRQLAVTRDLADDIERCMSRTDALFTMAVLGQMKAGKSTLLNALVGEDLAITGVTETTATVNWFFHGSPAQAESFEVVWRDESRPPELLPILERDKWIGDSALAKLTRRLIFFGTAEFLKTVRIVDTPGTKSTLPDHGQATLEFVRRAQERNDYDTRRFGESADCILYVLHPIAKDGDDELLNEFRTATRLPNTAAYNSVAVIHKWESMLRDHPDPMSEVRKKAQTAFTHLQELVSAVIPVSAPLFIAAQRCPHSFWEDIFTLVRRTPTEVLEYLLSTPDRFKTRTVSDCPFDAEKRRRLYEEETGIPSIEEEESGIPWECFAFILKLASRIQFDDAAALKAAIEEASGVHSLLELLNLRFFDRTRLIQASNQLSNALRLTGAARGRIRERLTDFDEQLENARAALEELTRFQNTCPRARAFIETRIRESQNEQHVFATVLRDIETQSRSIRNAFDQLTGDIDAMRRLDQHADEFESDERAEILTILGAFGFSIDQRLARIQLAGDDWLRPTERQLERWLHQYDRSESTRRAVLSQVVFRLESLIQALAQRPTRYDQDEVQ